MFRITLVVTDEETGAVRTEMVLTGGLGSVQADLDWVYQAQLTLGALFEQRRTIQAQGAVIDPEAPPA